MSRLYSDIILERFRHPRHLGELPDADAAGEDVNPLCGDRVRVEVQIGGGASPVVTAVRYRGDACAIALATADLLAEMVEGQPVAEAAQVDRERLLAALGAEIRPSRLRCVSLPLDVFRAALAELRGRGVDSPAGESQGSRAAGHLPGGYPPSAGR